MRLTCWKVIVFIIIVSPLQINVLADVLLYRLQHTPLNENEERILDGKEINLTF